MAESVPTTMFRGRVYRAAMRLAHRFSWHYAPEFGPIEPTGDYQRWCRWCGLRMSYRKDVPA